MVGLDRFELSTPRLSSVCSNQLSYRPSEKMGEEGRPDSKEPSGSLETEQRRVYEILRRPRTADPRGVRASRFRDPLERR